MVAEDNGTVAESAYSEEVVARGGTMQRVQTQHTTAVAVQRPRKLATVNHRLEEEAMLSGERFYYGWGAGKDKIEGPSIKLANAAARCWGNCAVELLPIQDLPDAWVFTAIFIDLETGFTTPRQFRQSKKHKVYGKHDEARKDDIRFQIGQSKAIRNVILNALPAGLIDNAMEAAKSGVRNKIEKFIADEDKRGGSGKGIVAAQDTILRELAKHGVKEADVFRKLEISERKAITVDRIVILRGDLAALNDGEVRADELFPLEGDAKSRVDALKGKKADEPKKPATAGKCDGAEAANTAGGSMVGGEDDPRERMK